MSVEDTVEEVVRAHHGWVLARLMRSLRDMDLAQDALQAALEAAFVQWTRDGVPETPRAWLVRTARNKAIDELRKRTLRLQNEPTRSAGWKSSVVTTPRPRSESKTTCCD